MQIQTYDTALFTLIENTEPQLRQLEENLTNHLNMFQNLATVTKLIRVYLMQGKLTHAENLCSDYLQNNQADKKIQKIYNTLNGLLTKSKEELQQGFTFSPFILLDSFLSRSHHQSLLDLVQNNIDHFIPAPTSNVNGTNKLTDFRSAIELPNDKIKSIREWFLELVFKSVKSQLHQLDIKKFKPSYKEMNLTASVDGNYFKIHTDNYLIKKRGGRILSFVYYFHQTPCQFTSGDLLLFDTDTENNSHDMNYTRITPINNRLICFPSDRYHCITKVHMKNHNLLQSRLTLHGCYHL